MAAPIPKPMVPRPPLEMNLRFLLNLRYWPAHIWCWPTSVTTGVSGVRCLLSMSRTRKGVMPLRLSAPAFSFSRYLLTCSVHSLFSFLSSMGMSFSSVSFISPLKPFSKGIFFPSSAPSISICTIFAFFANLLLFPVTRSLKRPPRDMMQSQLCIAMEDA